MTGTHFEAARIAISTYSRIPVPHTDWSEEGMRYSICCLPLIGVAVGFLELLAMVLLRALHAGDLLRGSVLAVLPLLVTGGIHFDGFMDTCDAIHSWKGREEKLAIMKDPHVGAFAVIGAVIYMTVMVGICSELTLRVMPVAALTFLLSRALSGLAATTFPKARKDGMLRAVTDPTTMRSVGILGVEVVLYAGIIVITGIAGGVWLAGLLTVAGAALIYVLYFFVMLLIFGGTTGDLAGWFLQIAELVMLFVLTLFK